MKRRKKKTGFRFKITSHQPSSNKALVDLEPEEFAVYVRRAEKKALPTIKEMRLGPGSAVVLLAQHAQIFATGDTRITEESMVSVTNRVLSLWQDGYYTPSPEYPFTFEEALRELTEGVKAMENYTGAFQAYTPLGENISCGIREISGGIVKHPETNLWQIWIMDDGPCTFIAAYHEPGKAQRNLEILINTIRHKAMMTTPKDLYQQLQSQADGQTQQLPYEMILYLIEHQENFTIKL
jgi:hypothetical protein